MIELKEKETATTTEKKKKPLPTDQTSKQHEEI